MKRILDIDNNVDMQVDLACTIVDCLTSGDMRVSFNAVNCLKQFQCVETLSSIPILAKLQSILAMDAKLRSRVYDVSYLLIPYSLTTLIIPGIFKNIIKPIILLTQII